MNHSSVGNTRILLREEGIGLTPSAKARGGKPAAREKRSVFPERAFKVTLCHPPHHSSLDWAIRE